MRRFIFLGVVILGALAAQPDLADPPAETAPHHAQTVGSTELPHTQPATAQSPSVVPASEWSGEKIAPAGLGWG